jgi:hypothetical protein
MRPGIFYAVMLLLFRFLSVVSLPKVTVLYLCFSYLHRRVVEIRMVADTICTWKHDVYVLDRELCHELRLNSLYILSCYR